MSLTEHGIEPIRGLPEALPEGERIVWQGAPSWQVLANRGFHLRLLAIYFAVLVAWGLIAAVLQDTPPREVMLFGLRTSACALFALGLVTLFAWLVARTTVYTITNRRVVLRFGVALPMTLNLPFSQIADAGLRLRPDGTGDLPLRMVATKTLTYVLLWPHARPWHITRPQPMLRAIADAANVAQILARAVAAAAPADAPVTVDLPLAPTGPAPTGSNAASSSQPHAAAAA